MSTKKAVAILGSGPAAFLAAHAVGLCGYPIAMFSMEEKSNIAGAQFLHVPIPECCEDLQPTLITYRVRGDAETYMEKVYGERGAPFVSFSSVEDGNVQQAWNMVGVYDRLWDFWSASMNQQQVTPMWLHEHMDDFAFVVSAIPKTALCWSHSPITPIYGEGIERPQGIGMYHSFTEQEVFIAPTCVEPLPDDTVLYDGTLDRSWYRSSNLFGVQGTEWSAGSRRPPIPNLVSIKKPLATTCDCFPDVVHVGRYGRWQKGVLVHDAFEATVRRLHAEGMIFKGSNN